MTQEEDKAKALIGGVGKPDPETNPYQIARELGAEMTAACTVVKTEERLGQCLDKIAELRERYSRVALGDAAAWSNQALSFARATGDMLVLAQSIAKTSQLRKESRGSHYRLDYPDRDDEQFLKTTVAEYRPGDADPHHIDYREVDTALVKPRPRTYGAVDSKPKKKDAEAATASS